MSRTDRHEEECVPFLHHDLDRPSIPATPTRGAPPPGATTTPCVTVGSGLTLRGIRAMTTPPTPPAIAAWKGTETAAA